MSWPAVLFWALIVFGVFSRGPFLLYVYAAAQCFGALQMIPLDTLTLVPQSICAAFLIAKILAKKENFNRSLNIALNPSGLGPLTIFFIYGLLSAYVMPRLFAHSLEVFPISSTVSWPTSLQPTTSNFTQSAYMAVSVGMALAFTIVGGNPDFRRHYLQSMLLGGVILIATGLIDLTTATLGIAGLLEPFRTANYVLFVDDNVLGAKRVVGLMSEASAYGGPCVIMAAMLAFLRPCFPDNLRVWPVPMTILGLLLMAMLSTSSTAYVGTAVFGVVFAANWLRRFTDGSALARADIKVEAFVVGGGALVFLFLITVAPGALNSIFNMVDELIFNKVGTDSYITRTMWTTVAMKSFFTTSGLGVGIGSARTSNWYISILSNTGIIGSVLLGWFIVNMFLRKVTSDIYTSEFVTGLKFSLLPWMAMAGLAGTTPDITASVGAIFGLITAAQTIQGKRQTPIAAPFMPL